MILCLFWTRRKRCTRHARKEDEGKQEHPADAVLCLKQTNKKSVSTKENGQGKAFSRQATEVLRKNGEWALEHRNILFAIQHATNRDRTQQRTEQRRITNDHLYQVPQYWKEASQKIYLSNLLG